jgi:CRISPR-associated exonuclease Cas4
LRQKDAIHYSAELVGAEKLLLTSLSSPSLGLRGALDCIIKTEKAEHIPVDYKNLQSNKGRVWMDHKYQLVAYALLINENFETQVRRGFVCYLPEKLIVELKITPTMKIHVKRIIGHIKRMIREEKLPPIRVAKHKCTG